MSRLPSQPNVSGLQDALSAAAGIQGNRNTRFLSLKTSLEGDEDVFLIESLAMHEFMSQPFQMELKLVVPVEDAVRVAQDVMIGHTMSVGANFDADSSDDGGLLEAVQSAVSAADGDRRFFHGIVNRFVREGRDGDFVKYHAELVSWLSLLDYNRNCRVFEHKSVPEILTEVFDEWRERFKPLVEYEIGVKPADYKKLDYCVQYRESDFHFISRLMEREGLFYFFEHEEDHHKLVVGDAAWDRPPCRHRHEVRLLDQRRGSVRGHAVTSWSVGHTLVPGKFVLGDYQFQAPSAKSVYEEKTVLATGRNWTSSAGEDGSFNDDLEVFEYPGMFAKRFNEPDERMDEQPTVAEKLANTRAEEQDCRERVFRGTSNCVMFEPGRWFNLDDGGVDPRTAIADRGDYLLTGVMHFAEQSPDPVSGRAASRPYRNSFSGIVRGSEFRPLRSTPRPVIQGLQTAVVVGPEGEEIYTDKFGRVRVKFHWDRDKDKPDEQRSCWLRVAQPMAGQGWGAHFWPRVGHEVVVAFLEGDPDQPIIVGSLYNTFNMPPYTMSKHKTRSGIKTRSTPDGNEQNFNEIRFEDKKGEEQVYIHAERNLDTVVEANETRNVGGSQTLTVKQYRQTYIEGDDQEFVYGEEGKKVEVEADIGMWARNEMHLTASNWLYLNSLYDAVMIHAPKSVSVQSDTEIVLEVGNSSLTINHAGITLKGPIVKIEGDMLTQVKGLMTQVEATGILATKAGAITQIR